jgi:hypothetical protein
MLAAVLLRASVLFREERGDPATGRLSPVETADALSRALANRRIPATYGVAARGLLADRAHIEAHLWWVLNDPKTAKPRLAGFFREYFEYHNAPDVFKDQPKDQWHVPTQYVTDTDLLIEHVLRDDRDVLSTLLTTRLSFVNVRMRENKQTRKMEPTRSMEPNAYNQRGQADVEALYGLGAFPVSQPVALPEGTRAGILMQPSWLVAWSENFNSDVVRRGKWIRERLLGGVVPDLPIGVAAMIPDEPHHALRERLRVTREESCWKCHRYMDDLGLPFEQFDHYARFRTVEKVLDPEATAAHVDAKGKHLGDVFRDIPLDTRGRIRYSGDSALDGPVGNPFEMMEKLASSDLVRQVFIRHVFRYFMGRNESLADASTLRAADEAYLQGGGSFKALVVSLLTSDSFLGRAVPEAPPVSTAMPPVSTPP